MRTDVTTQIVRNGWPILGLSAYTPDIEQTVIEKGNEQLATYGVVIIRMGNFDVNLSDRGRSSSRGWPRTPATPGWPAASTSTRPARWRSAPAQGMAQGGGAVSGAFLGVGLGHGRQWPPASRTAPTPPPPAGFAGGGAGGYAGPPPAASAPAASGCHRRRPSRHRALRAAR